MYVGADLSVPHTSLRPTRKSNAAEQRLLRCFLNRQNYDKSGAAPIVCIFNPDSSAVCFHYSLSDRQPHAGPFRLTLLVPTRRAVKLIEYSFTQFRWNARTFIGDAQSH